MTNKKSSGWLLFVGMLLAIPVLYLLSFGPACWLLSPRVPRMYWPIGWLALHSKSSARIIVWYATLLDEPVPEPPITVPAEPQGNADVVLMDGDVWTPVK